MIVSSEVADRIDELEKALADVVELLKRVDAMELNGLLHIPAREAVRAFINRAEDLL